MTKANHSSNTQAEIEAICAGVITSLRSGTDCSWESLKAHCQAGVGLMRLKKVLPHGQFGRAVTERFHISKQWSARLMELARDWGDIEHAVTWARANGRPLFSLSVDGALALLRKWRQEVSGGNAKRTARAQRMSETEKLRSQLRATLAELMQARTRIRLLEGEIARLRPPIDSAAKARAEKVAALWRRPGFKAEGRNAELRLHEMAKRFDRTLADFLTECGIESPVGWTDEDTQFRAA